MFEMRISSKRLSNFHGHEEIKKKKKKSQKNPKKELRPRLDFNVKTLRYKFDLGCDANFFEIYSKQGD